MNMSKPLAPIALEQLGSIKLPALTPGIPFLLKSLGDENIGYSELASILEKFPGIAAKLIALVNSVWSSPVAEITGLEEACVRLGIDVVKSASISLALSAPFDFMKCASFDSEYYWHSALLTAQAASMLANVSTCSSGLSPSTARTAGLLHNLGLLWLVDKKPVEVSSVFSMLKTHEIDSLEGGLFDALGFDQVQAGGYLGRSWELPETLVAAMGHYPESDYQGVQIALVTTVGLAVKLVSTVLGEQVCPSQDSRQEALGITSDQLERVHSGIQQQLEKTRALAQVFSKK